jgi:hypothetical protein
MSILSRQQEANEKVRREARYEQCVSQQQKLTQTIAQLEADAAKYDTSALAKIQELALTLPPTLLTNGVSSLAVTIPGNVVVRNILQMIVVDAFNFAVRRNGARLEALSRAKKDLEKIEAEIAVIGPEFAV